jgi:succinoglycan biosynthesis protein ExoM
MRTALISLLIPTYNRCAWLREALESAAQQRTGGEFALEIVVVDNNSSDETPLVVQQVAQVSDVPIHYVLWTSRGDAQARNGGLPHCRGDWIAFMDDDELAEPDWLSELFRVAREQQADLVGGAVLLDMPPDELSGLGIDVRRSLRERSAATIEGGTRPFRSREYPGTDNLLISRRVLETLGDFDENLMSGTADYDFSLRAHRHGFRCWFAPRAVVRHRCPAYRLTPEFIGWESLRSGIMLALYDGRYLGRLKLTAWMAARCGQGLLVHLPRWVRARASGDQARLSDQRIRLLRLKGYALSYLCEIAPRWFPRSALNAAYEFNQGRQIGRLAPQGRGTSKTLEPQDHAQEAAEKERTSRATATSSRGRRE